MAKNIMCYDLKIGKTPRVLTSNSQYVVDKIKNAIKLGHKDITLEIWQDEKRVANHSIMLTMALEGVSDIDKFLLNVVDNKVATKFTNTNSIRKE